MTQPIHSQHSRGWDDSSERNQLLLMTGCVLHQTARIQERRRYLRKYTLIRVVISRIPGYCPDDRHKLRFRSMSWQTRRWSALQKATYEVWLVFRAKKKPDLSVYLCPQPAIRRNKDVFHSISPKQFWESSYTVTNFEFWKGRPSLIPERNIW